ncbi:Uncharacterized conserved protein [Butyrivibrio sp. ob235]|uniref:motility associated factor glycosyltransferase family protein n=1 Tax=Butyrivibrio sp. ob235 TaxID=1761780 RepID=UPI0008D75AEB|nr:6-hydroxymethylpterin diphosphokinase MptE-like protein [Butyrivibrio sp. ob235]SEM24465.1 Uncharacterized conserved protein [Butyrivibrio sp. ob235]
MSLEGKEVNELHKDENLRETNFKLFETRYGVMPVIGAEEDKQYRIETASNGEAVLYVKGVGGSGDFRLNSSYSPSYEADIWADGRKKASRRTIVIVCGFSTGVYIKALLKKMRSDTEIYVYEPNEALFSFVCSYVDLSDLIGDSRIHIFIKESQINRMTDVIHNMIIVSRPEVRGIITPFYVADDRYKKICDEIGALSIALRNFKKSRGRDALRCRIYAWKHLSTAHVLSDAKDIIPTECPAVIVAAGPSLGKNVHLLKELKHHALIISTDRALDTLKENGILPDAAISVDALKSSDFLNYAYEKNIPIICSYQLNIDAQKRPNGNLIFFDEISYEKKLLGRSFAESSIDMGGNVAGAAYSVLRILGFKTIILIGQDLAYLGEKHHADTKDDGMDEIEDVIEVPGYDGTPVKSNGMWIKYRDFYERQIKMYPEVKIIDATEGGALIQGSEVLPLQTVVEKYNGKTTDYENVFKELPFAVEKEGIKRINDVFSVWTDELKEIIDVSGILTNECQKIMELIDEHGISSPKADGELAKMDALRKKIYSYEMNNLLEEYWVEDMYSIPPKVLYLRTDKEAKDTLRECSEYYENLSGDAKSLLEAFDYIETDM